MSLLDFAQTKPFANAMAQAVKSRQMPPWYADPSIGQFSNNRSLTDAEVQTIVWQPSGAWSTQTRNRQAAAQALPGLYLEVEWASVGAPAGDPEDAPAPVQWIDGWTIGRPRNRL